LEHIRRFAGEVIGHLNSIAIVGLREPHGDVIGMLHLIDPTVAALEASEQPVTIMQKEMKTLKVHPERMLAVIRHSYIASTELANQMVRDYGLDYRTAHEIIHKFVLASEKQGIPATEARVELLDAAAEEVLDKRLGMTEARLRELLDPAYFIKVTNSKGGVSPEEVARMIADRRQKLAEARNRHLERIETLEKAQERMLADLKATCGASGGPPEVQRDEQQAR
jgi:argininosuccinate lyase